MLKRDLLKKGLFTNFDVNNPFILHLDTSVFKIDFVNIYDDGFFTICDDGRSRPVSKQVNKKIIIA